MRMNIKVRNVLRSVAVLLVAASLHAMAGDIKPSVEIEFNLFYNRNYPQPFSFQFREAKLFLDTRISDRWTALIEYVLKDNLQRAELERAYFTQHELPWNSQLTLGQFRLPFGYYDQFTVSRSLTKDAALAPDSLMPTFHLRTVDVGALWETLGENLSFSLAVVNGNGVNSLSDDNIFKDIVAHAAYTIGDFQGGLNVYYGRKNSLNADLSVRKYSGVEVAAYGVEGMLTLEKAVIAGEAVTRHYGPLVSNGAYVMMNYDLGSIVKTLRTTTRAEYFDPNTGRPNDDRIQWSQGLLYTVARGYTAKLECVLNLERNRHAANEFMFELEYEL
jgi:hypothetical protein